MVPPILQAYQTLGRGDLKLPKGDDGDGDVLGGVPVAIRSSNHSQSQSLVDAAGMGMFGSGRNHTFYASSFMLV